jgi:hypothetical protein
MGKAKMALELDLNETEAAALISQFQEKVPFLKRLVSAVQERIDRPGWYGLDPHTAGASLSFPALGACSLWDTQGLASQRS